MAIAFPGTASDISVAHGANPLTVTPPANVADGDLLMFFAMARFGFFSNPSGPSQLADWSATGEFQVRELPVPSAAGLPASWSWNLSSGTRASVICIRVTGVNLAAPITQTGSPFAEGTLPMVLPGVSYAGGAVAWVGTYFTGDGNVPLADFVPGFTLLTTLSTLTSGEGRSSQGIYVATGSGNTGSITTANDWPGSPTGQDGILAGLQQTAAPAPQYLYQMRMMP